MKLTNERIEVAIEDLKTVPTRCYSLDNKDGTIPKYSAISEESRNTILAALDACRWRDAETEPPEPCELVRDEYGDLCRSGRNRDAKLRILFTMWQKTASYNRWSPVRLGAYQEKLVLS